MFIVVEGQLAVMKNGKLLRQLSSLDYFGERCLLLEEPRTADVVCQSPEATLYSMSKETFEKVFFLSR